MSDLAAHEPAPTALDEGRDRSARLGPQLLRRKTALVGIAGIVLLVAVAVTAPWIAAHAPNEPDLANNLAPPFWSADGSLVHPLGTDSLGRDVLSRMLYGARNSVMISFLAMAIGASLGLVTGLTAGFMGRLVDTLLMRLGDVQLALPFILIAIVILGVMPDRRPIHLILVLGIPTWIIYARVVRSRVLAERDLDYVRAATVLGASRLRRMVRYVLPSVWRVVPAIALVDLGFLVIMESTLSFLGFGLTPPEVSWGQILADGRQNMAVSPWLPVLPGVAIMLSVLSINLAADGLSARPSLKPSSRPGPDTHEDTPAAKRPAPRVESPAAGDAPLLSVTDLSVAFPLSPERSVRAVRDASFEVGERRIVGIVGESGSGKSVTAYAIMRLLDEPGRITSGEIRFEGTDLARAPEHAMRRLRGSRIGMIFQNPTGSLNPVLTVGFQMIETVRHHQHADRTRARRLAEQALRRVGFADPAHIMGQYPFRLSGGMNQRVMIALATVFRPRLLIADEPTTALDVTTQAQVLAELRKVRDEDGASIVLISHDIGLIGEIADDVVVMYAGMVAETGSIDAVLDRPQHPYTQALLRSVPHVGAAQGELETISGELPDATARIIGCPFADRCPEVMDVCRDTTPPHFPAGAGQTAACHLHDVAHRMEAGR